MIKSATSSENAQDITAWVALHPLAQSKSSHLDLAILIAPIWLCAYVSAVLTGSSTSACGSGRHGRLGLGSQANASVFTHIDALEERCLHGLACGLDHTLVLASDT